mmetsp:Transcript_130542/g.377641  ORF Transcript_130542/g.377641 Transcript_130542/m.377641 type:complete len:256 (-) Transcript_130542:907-1674(-)
MAWQRGSWKRAGICTWERSSNLSAEPAFKRPTVASTVYELARTQLHKLNFRNTDTDGSFANCRNNSTRLRSVKSELSDKSTSSTTRNSAIVAATASRSSSAKPLPWACKHLSPIRRPNALGGCFRTSHSCKYRHLLEVNGGNTFCFGPNVMSCPPHGEVVGRDPGVPRRAADEPGRDPLPPGVAARCKVGSEVGLPRVAPPLIPPPPDVPGRLPPGNLLRAFHRTPCSCSQLMPHAMPAAPKDGRRDNWKGERRS